MKNYILLFCPKLRRAVDIFTDIDDVCVEFGFKNTELNGCLNDNKITVRNLILKYQKLASDENISRWCDCVHIALDNTIRCTCCQDWKMSDQFKHGFRCIDCEHKRLNEYGKTSLGFFKRMIFAMKTATKQKQGNGRDICNVELTYQNLLDLYDEQNGKCWYTGIQLNYGSLVDWKISPERLNNDIGYIKGNVKLVCLEFNNARQWTHEKIASLKKLSISKTNLKDLEEQVELASSHKKVISKIIERKLIVDSITVYLCLRCKEHKKIDQYTMSKSGTNSYCIPCDSIKRKEYSNTLRGFVLGKIASAKNRSIKRKQEFTIDMEWAFQQLLIQKGRCYYSGIPLTFTINTPWQLSVERLDSCIGYTKENTVLICLEFNTSDHTIQSIGEPEGSGQWSKDKFNFLLQHI
jgi:hypothetical protein